MKKDKEQGFAFGLVTCFNCIIQLRFSLEFPITFLSYKRKGSTHTSEGSVQSSLFSLRKEV